MKQFNVSYLCSLTSPDLMVVTESGSWRKVYRMSVSVLQCVYCVCDRGRKTVIALGDNTDLTSGAWALHKHTHTHMCLQAFTNYMVFSLMRDAENTKIETYSHTEYSHGLLYILYCQRFAVWLHAIYLFYIIFANYNQTYISNESS